MKIAVCVKRVPDMDVRFKIGADNLSLDEAGLKFDINDFDAWAVEAALQLKEKNAGSEVTVISLGPDVVQETIRKALSMGADRGIQLKADKIPFDGFAIAKGLAEELKDGAYDLILFGKMSPDSSNGVVGPMAAELLGLAVRHGDLQARHREREGNRQARARGRAGNRRVSAAGSAHRRRRPQHGALPVAQGDHGGEEEAARSRSRRNWRSRRSPFASSSSRPSAKPDESSAKARRPCPSWSVSSRPRRRFSDGEHLRVRRIARHGELRKVGARSSHRRADARRQVGRWRSSRASRSAPPGIAAKADQLGQYGADVVIVVEHDGLAQYNPEVATATAAERIKSGGYRAARVQHVGAGARSRAARGWQDSA